MLKRIRPSVGSAHVIALLALFAALGGGYATAFSGSGTLQKGSVGDLNSSFVNFRTLTGIGELQAACAVGPDDTEVRVHNSSGEDLYMSFSGDVAGKTVVSDGADSSEINLPGTTNTVRIHLWPFDESKSPQADILVSTKGPMAGDCSGSTNSAATALVLNTQE
jgi:hypothetical protein